MLSGRQFIYYLDFIAKRMNYERNYPYDIQKWTVWFVIKHK